MNQIEKKHSHCAYFGFVLNKVHQAQIGKMWKMFTQHSKTQLTDKIETKSTCAAFHFHTRSPNTNCKINSFTEYFGKLNATHTHMHTRYNGNSAFCLVVWTRAKSLNNYKLWFDRKLFAKICQSMKHNSSR